MTRWLCAPRDGKAMARADEYARSGVTAVVWAVESEES